MFLHANPQDNVRLRSRSWSSGDRHDYEVELAVSDVSPVPGKSEDLALLEAEIEIAADIQRTPGEEDDAGTPNPDGPTPPRSLHAAGTCNPCVYFASLHGCHWANCGFCHLGHGLVKKLRPRKQARDAYKQKLAEVLEETAADSGIDRGYGTWSLNAEQRLQRLQM